MRNETRNTKENEMSLKQAKEWSERGLTATDPMLHRLAVNKLKAEARRRGLTYQELLSVVRGENG